MILLDSNHTEEHVLKELEIFSKRYFKNEQSYERALINQLYGNFYAVQGMYDQAIEKYEAALVFRKIPFVTSLAVRKNLAQCYFQLSNYKKTIDVLEAYLDVAKKRGQLYSPRDLIMLGISYYQEGNYLKSYENIIAEPAGAMSSAALRHYRHKILNKNKCKIAIKKANKIMKKMEMLSETIILLNWQQFCFLLLILIIKKETLSAHQPSTRYQKRLICSLIVILQILKHRLTTLH